jgi:hypothetical protein
MSVALIDGKGCGLKKLQTVHEHRIWMLLVPDERRTRGTPSLARLVVDAVAGDANRGVKT